MSTLGYTEPTYAVFLPLQFTACVSQTSSLASTETKTVLTMLTQSTEHILFKQNKM